MPTGLPGWALGLGAILALAIPVVLDFLAKRKDKKDSDALVVKTNPADPAGVADFDERQRVQDARKLPTKP